VSRLLHHQKPPAPSNATRITTTIPTLIAQRIAIFAIRKKMASKTTPAITEIVVKLIDYVSSQWSVGNLGLPSSFCLLLAAYCLLSLVTGSYDSLDVSPNVKVAFNLHAQRIAGAYEILKNHIDNVLVKDLHISK
jgi:hypothetical protein